MAHPTESAQPVRDYEEVLRAAWMQYDKLWRASARLVEPRDPQETHAIYTYALRLQGIVQIMFTRAGLHVPTWEDRGDPSPSPSPSPGLAPVPGPFPGARPSVVVPSVRRLVSYRAYGSPGGEYPAGVDRAALITEVDVPGDPDSPVGLCVINPTGMFFTTHVKRGSAPGQWDWPPPQSPRGETL